MIPVSTDPVLFSIGYFHLRWYSMIVMLAIFARRKHWNLARLLDAFAPGAIFVILWRLWKAQIRNCHPFAAAHGFYPEAGTGLTTNANLRWKIKSSTLTLIIYSD